MQKSVLLVTYVHKHRIQRRHHLLHPAVIDVSHGKSVVVAALTTNLHQTVVFGESNSDFLRLDVHNQFAFHNKTNKLATLHPSFHQKKGMTAALWLVKKSKLVSPYRGDTSLFLSFDKCHQATKIILLMLMTILTQTFFTLVR